MTEHVSDCAVNNEPAYPNGECDCQPVKDIGPRVTEGHIKSLIMSTSFSRLSEVFPEHPEVDVLSRVTLCVLTLKNGFVVTGQSACVSAENFDVRVGREFAYKDALEKIWMLEGYALMNKLSGL